MINSRPVEGSVRRLYHWLWLGVLLMIFGQASAFAANCTATYNHTVSASSSANFNLNSGEALKIAAGTYTGNVNNFSSGATICVETGAVFTPSTLNNAAGTIKNYGTANLQTFSYNAGTVIDNYNTLTFTDGLNTNGAVTFKNRSGATMTMNNSFQLGNNSVLTNDGVLVAKQDFNTQSGTTLTNNYRMELEGNFNPSGVVNNYGRVFAKKFMNINSGSTLTNYCSLVSYDGFNNNSGNTANFGFIVITTASGGIGGAWQNNAAFYNHNTGTIAGGDFTNNSTLTTAGAFIFSGTTRNQGTFKGTSTTETINFYDETQTGSQIFDYQNVMPQNTVRTSFAHPTALSSVDSCSSAYKAFAPPVRRDYSDAPATYGSASHVVDSTLYLGSKMPDAESVALFSRNAYGDENNGTADEDGAPSESESYYTPLFPILKMTATSYAVDIHATNATTTDATLYAWIDFDQSGTFEADEAASVLVPANRYDTTVTLTWSAIPMDIKLGTTFIRLRLTNDSGVSTSVPFSDAGIGEVEDFALAVAQAIPPESPNVTVVLDDTAVCSTELFHDDFNDLTEDTAWGANVAGSSAIRNWDRAGGGTDTYAYVRNVSAYGLGLGMYFGNGAVRRISPAIPGGFSFDANGRLLNTIDAIEIRDNVDDYTPNSVSYESDWGPYPVMLSRTFATQAGKKYRVYFDAVPEPANNYNGWKSGIMRIDTPSGSAHFRAPGDTEGVKHYRIEFTANAASSTISFVNYGHFSSADNGWCQPTSIWGAWCTVGGDAVGKYANELIIDNVKVAATSNCQPGSISGTVYRDTNANKAFDNGEAGLKSITVNLYNDAGTPAIVADDVLVATTSTANDGSYGFSDVDPLQGYRLEVDTADTDLPNSFLIGTTNPLTGITVTAGGTTANQNFGFYSPNQGDVSGKVFDDVNYGGGAGRALGTAGTAGVNGATVELYNASGALTATTTTTSDGSYSFAGQSNGSYYVRVVNGSVKSSRSGSTGAERGIQTFRTDGKTAVTHEVGGRKPASVDAPANTTGLTLNTTTFLFSDGAVAQSVQPITITGNASGVNFGFNFSTVVNTNDSGQGSLRQGILNINLLANTGLAQVGQNNVYGLDSGVTKEVLLFNIPASGDPLGRADSCGGTVCKITVASELPTLTAPAIVDATTQPNYVAGTPGMPLIHLVPATGLDARGFVMGYLAPDSTLRGVAITGFRTKNSNRGLTVEGERSLVEANYIGLTPAGVADGNGNGIELAYTQSAVIGGSSAAQRNVISGNKSLGIFHNTGAAGSTIQNNFIGTNPAGTAAIPNESSGIDTEGGSSIKILDNVIAGNLGNGVELGFSGGTGGVANAIIKGNRIGVGITGEALGNGGPGIMNYGGSSGHQISENIIANNTLGGIRFYTTNIGNIVISQNSLYANGNLGIDLNNNGVSVNDANDVDVGANAVLNFPMLSSVTLLNGNMTLNGCAPAGAKVELFEADVSTGGKAKVGDNKVGKTKDYGEGQTYLGSFVEGSSDDTNSSDCALASDTDGNTQTGMKAFSIVMAKPDAVVMGDLLTATATVSGTGTSEFAPVLAITPPPGISGKIFDDVNYAGGNGRELGTSGTLGVAGTTVELYNAAGALLTSSTSATDGSYTLTGVSSGTYYVRVVNGSVKSSRSGSTGAERGIQTFRTDGVTPVLTEIGGRKPAVVDAEANTTGQTLNTTTFVLSGGGQAQSVQPVSVSGSSVAGVNFGFNFSTIVNTNDSGQGSLRQFILNSNVLAQNGVSQDLPSSLKTEYGAGKEVSIFMIPNAALSSGVAIFTPVSVLPASIKSNVIFDARTQTLNIGDTNAGTVGETLSAGVDSLSVKPVNRPEIALDCSAVPAVTGAAEYCMTVSGTGAYVRGFAFYGANTGTLDEPSAALYVASTATANISGNLFGTMADGTEPVWLKQNRRMGLMVEGSAAVGENYFAYNGYGAAFKGTQAINSSFIANQMNYNGPNLEKDALNGLEDGDALAIFAGAEVIIVGNHLQNSRGKSSSGNSGGNGNIDHGNLIEVAGAGKATITNNTLINGFTANVGIYDGSQNVTVTYNVITAARGTGSSPTGTGVLVNPEGATPSAVLISRNSIYANNGLGIDLDPGNQSQTGNRVTKNDSHDSDHGPNELLNFPFFTETTLQYGKLVLAGCAPAGATIELFEADVSPGGTDAEGANKFGNAKDYGEGQFYLTSLVEGSSGDTDSSECGHISDSDGNNNRGMAAFHFLIAVPDRIVAGDKLTATATLAGIGTSEFSLVSDGITTVTYHLSGTVFEDVNYGGGAGRAFGTAGTAGMNGVTVELYDASTGEAKQTTTTANDGTQDGRYTFTGVGVGSYYVRVVNGTVKSTRTGGKTSEVGVQTFRTNGSTATTAEIGGKHPAEVDAAAQQGASVLNITTFMFEKGPLNGTFVQTLQKVDVGDNDATGVDFGFNFDSIVNTNDTGQGSLRQAMLNANLLGNDASLAQTGLTAGKENLLWQLTTTDANYNAVYNYWSIALKSALPNVTAPLQLNGALQAGFVDKPVIELLGNNAGNGVHGMTLAAGSDGSAIKALAINRFSGVGIYLNGSNNNTLQANYLGINPSAQGASGNGGGIRLDASSGNLIGGTETNKANLITANTGAGVAVRTTSNRNSILGNSIYDNSNGLGIDLNGDGVTANDTKDTDTGANDLLNFPEVKMNSFGTNGTRIVTYDFDLDVPVGSYRVEFFANDARDPSDYGEGKTFLGYKTIEHKGTGAANFKGTFNANQTVASDTLIAATLTAKLSDGSYGATSEFSGVKAGIDTTVCTSLITGTGADMMIDENASPISLLEAKDASGNPITYVISGGADSHMFHLTAPVSGATLDCTTLEFADDDIVVTKSLPTVRANSQIPIGDYEVPQDSDRDNVYDLQITATDAQGQKYVRDLRITVQNVNEAPLITTAAAVNFTEDTNTAVVDINAQDEDGDKEGSGLSYRISGGADQAFFAVDASNGVLTFRAVPDYDAPNDAGKNNTYEVAVSVTDSEGLSVSKTFGITVLNNTADDGVKVQVRALLQGAYNSKTELMATTLHQAGLLPASQPYAAAPFNYSGSETFSDVLNVAAANDEIVDWMLVDLRNSQTAIAATRAVMVQADGDLVDAQSGANVLHFAKVTAGNYYVSVRHRNHLAAITASPLSLSADTSVVDFSLAATPVMGEQTRLVAGGLALLWAGDINGSNTLSASGPNNDATSLLSNVLTHAANGNANTNYVLRGYLATDVNLDGKVLFSGPDNDASALMGNIIMHPLNTSFVGNYIVRGGLVTE